MIRKVRVIKKDMLLQKMKLKKNSIQTNFLYRKKSIQHSHLKDKE